MPFMRANPDKCNCACAGTHLAMAEFLAKIAFLLKTCFAWYILRNRIYYPHDPVVCLL